MPTASVIEEIMPPGVSVPLHVHSREDELTYVVAGRVHVLRGADRSLAAAGDLIFLPRGTAHAFMAADDAPARLLTVVTPSELEDFFRNVAKLGALAETEPERVDSLARQHGVSIIDSIPPFDPIQTSS